MSHRVEHDRRGRTYGINIVGRVGLRNPQGEPISHSDKPKQRVDTSSDGTQGGTTHHGKRHPRAGGDLQAQEARSSTPFAGQSASDQVLSAQEHAAKQRSKN